jgi:hypothetical protein
MPEIELCCLCHKEINPTKSSMWWCSTNVNRHLDASPIPNANARTSTKKAEDEPPSARDSKMGTSALKMTDERLQTKGRVTERE